VLKRVRQDVALQNSFLLVEWAFMSVGQAILFGMMLVWTPSVVLLAWLLWKERIGVKDV
jgi:hypothetical protein